MSDSQHILWENREGMGLLTLNRPEKHNAMTFEMFCEMAERLEACQTDESVKVIIVRGVGDNFSAGGDIKGHPTLTLTSKDNRFREEYLRVGHRIPLCIRRLPQPVIAALQGIVGGAGLDVAAACDIRIAAENARLGVFFTRVGLIPDMGGSYLLPRLLGPSKAMELCFTGDLIDAAEAHRIGLVNRVVATEELEEAVMAFAKKLALGPLQAHRLNKQAAYRNVEQQIEIALEREIAGVCELYCTEDFKEGISAFQNGRKPVFQGK
jgi:2-(1,2-epoxy-1,2-dihydrophenyl)acetyl-CoA isomerase